MNYTDFKGLYSTDLITNSNSSLNHVNNITYVKPMLISKQRTLFNTDLTPDSKPDSNSGQTPDTQPDTDTGLTPDTKPDSKPSQTPDTKPDSNSSQTPDTQPDSNSGQTPDTKPDSNSGQTPNSKPDTDSSQTPNTQPMQFNGHVIGNGRVKEFDHGYDTNYYYPGQVKGIGLVRNMGKISQILDNTSFVDNLFDKFKDTIKPDKPKDTTDTTGPTQQPKPDTDSFFDWVISDDTNQDTTPDTTPDQQPSQDQDNDFKNILEDIRNRGIMKSVDARQYDNANDLVFIIDQERKLNPSVKFNGTLQEKYLNYNKDLYTNESKKYYPSIITATDISNYLQQPITTDSFNHTLPTNTLFNKVKNVATSILNIFNDVYLLFINKYEPGSTLVQKLQIIFLQKNRLFGLGCLLALISLFVFLRKGH